MLKSLNYILSSILILSLLNCGGGPTKEQKEVRCPNSLEM